MHDPNRPMAVRYPPGFERATAPIATDAATEWAFRITAGLFLLGFCTIFARACVMSI